MSTPFSLIPESIDLLHLILAVLVIVLFAKRVKPVAVPQVETAPAPQPVPPAPLQESTPDAALQLLSVLQQDARFLDFVHEDLSSYSDADIGAAARVVHEGSKKTLSTYFTLEAIRSEEEESQLTLAAGFDPSEVRLTGNVVGAAPFTGTLIHRGWKATEVRLPKRVKGHNAHILAAAEVEL
jgi:hypothetical protein